MAVRRQGAADRTDDPVTAQGSESRPGRESAQQPDRPGVRAVRRYLVHDRPAAEPVEAFADQFGGLPFAVRRRKAGDGRQLLDDGSQELLHGARLPFLDLNHG